MRDHKHASESTRTALHAGPHAGRHGGPRAPPAVTDLAAFREHFARTMEFTDALREGRCRRTNHFEARLGETVSVFKPLFAPWNMEALFLLYMHGPMRFNALKRMLNGISSRVLTDKLRHLASGDLVTRRESGDAVEYALTPRGEVVARHLHPLVFYLHNEGALSDPRP